MYVATTVTVFIYENQMKGYNCFVIIACKQIKGGTPACV